MESLNCSFTGHRIIKAEHESSLPELLSRAIAYAYSIGCRTFYSGGAIGFDTVAAREVIRFRVTHPDVRLVLLLPCVDQDAKWSTAQRSAYAFILSMADETEYVSECYTDSCIRERNMRLAELCDIMIAYVAHTKSGTAQTVRMARSKNKKIYNLYPTLEREEETEKK